MYKSGQCVPKLKVYVLYNDMREDDVRVEWFVREEVDYSDVHTSRMNCIFKKNCHLRCNALS